MRLWQLQVLVVALLSAMLLGFGLLPALLKPASLRQACGAQAPDGTTVDRGREICRE
jgi:hypothetical protein